MPGIITSSSTMSGGSPCWIAASISSPREYDARLVAAQRQERPQVARECRIVVDDGDRWPSLVGRRVRRGAGARANDCRHACLIPYTRKREAAARTPRATCARSPTTARRRALR